MDRALEGMERIKEIERLSRVWPVLWLRRQPGCRRHRPQDWRAGGRCRPGVPGRVRWSPATSTSRQLRLGPARRPGRAPSPPPRSGV